MNSPSWTDRLGSVGRHASPTVIGAPVELHRRDPAAAREELERPIVVSLVDVSRLPTLPLVLFEQPPLPRGAFAPQPHASSELSLDRL